MADINPYQILGIPNDATLEMVKDAYRQLATKHHPDKGGNQETFKIIKLSFKMIVDNIKKGIQIPKNGSSTHIDMKEASQNLQTSKHPTPHEFFGQKTPIDPNNQFDAKTFNQKFVRNLTEDNNCLLNQNMEDYRETRTKNQLLTEQETVNNELSNIKPIFTGKEFNNNVFNRLFEQLNGKPDEKTELQVYEEPQALTSGLQPFTEIDDNQKIKQTDKFSSLGFSNVTEGFGQKIPTHFDRTTITQLAQQPDITDVKTLEPDYHNKMKQRLNNYQNAQISFHPKPTDTSKLPSQLVITNASTDKISQQGLNDFFNLKIQERNGLINEIKFGTQRGDKVPPPPLLPKQDKGGLGGTSSPPQQQYHTLPIMDYPKNSNIEQSFNQSNQQQQFPQSSHQQSFLQTSHQQLFQQQPQYQQFSQRGDFIPPQQTNDYFVKIQPTPQNYAQMYPHAPQSNDFFRPIGKNDNAQQVNSSRGGQSPPQTQPDLEQIQQQLQDLQKTVKNQKKLIKKFTTKK